jgi:hypothetical protein
MAAWRDAWYVRLPDGQELRAKTTKAVVHHIETGVIPKNSLVRRSHTDEWTILEWTSEFAEILAHRPTRETGTNGSSTEKAQPPTSTTGLASRLDPLRLRTVGVRGLWDDLLAALDSALSGGKPIVAALAGAAVGLILIVLPWVILNVFLVAGWTDVRGDPLVWPARIVTWAAGAIALIVVAWANGLLARMTHAELSELRPVRVREASAGSGRLISRLACAYLLVVGGALLLMHGVRWVPGALAARAAFAGLTGDAFDLLLAGLSVAGLVVEAALWCSIALVGLFAPILVVEDLSLGRALGAWARLIREHLGRLLLGEALAVGLGSLAALPFALPVWLAADHYPGLPAAAQNLAYGIALAPLTAFLAVANVFIYLDVRYEHHE